MFWQSEWLSAFQAGLRFSQLEIIGLWLWYYITTFLNLDFIYRLSLKSRTINLPSSSGKEEDTCSVWSGGPSCPCGDTAGHTAFSRIFYKNIFHTSRRTMYFILQWFLSCNDVLQIQRTVMYFCGQGDKALFSTTKRTLDHLHPLSFQTMSTLKPLLRTSVTHICYYVNYVTRIIIFLAAGAKILRVEDNWLLGCCAA
jgi:hypothetical protein